MQSQHDKLYKRFKGGDPRALPEILDAERRPLYDYLMRMTGQMAKSSDTVDEVYQTLTEETLESVGSFLELKTMLYATARRFVADVWNADTSRLMNAAIDGPTETGARETEATQADRDRARPIDRAVRMLPGQDREVVLLRARCGFEDQDIATIMGMGVGHVGGIAATAMARVSAECSGLNAQSLSAAIARMPHHPEPVRSSQRTINLSMVMQGIKAKPVGLWSPFRIGLVVLLALAGFAYALKPELATELIEALKGLIDGVPSSKP